jgi:hypothetical protein
MLKMDLRTCPSLNSSSHFTIDTKSLSIPSIMTSHFVRWFKYYSKLTKSSLLPEISGEIVGIADLP